jgi:hypothetical protein
MPGQIAIKLLIAKCQAAATTFSLENPILVLLWLGCSFRKNLEDK